MLNKKTIGAMLGAMVIAAGSLSAESVHPNGCKGPDLCTSNPVIDSCGWSFNVGLIAEQMRITNTDVAFYTGTSGEGTAASPSTQRFIKSTQFDLDVGLRIGVGYEFNHDDWRAAAEFEWLHSKGTFNDKVDSGNFRVTHIPDIFDLVQTVAVAFQNVNSSLEVDYYVLDVYLARGSYLSGRFSYEPFAGLKASWINYNGSRKFSNATATSSMAATSAWLNTTVTEFWGVGPEVGMNGNYYVCSGWSLFSSANFAVLFGETRIRDQMGIVTTEPVPFTEGEYATLVVMSPTVRTIVGLQYDQDVMNEKQHFSFRAGFDARYYFNQHPIINRPAKAKLNNTTTDLRLSNAPETIDNGSFGMLGLILDVGYEF